jgi:hypothetical protein
VNQDPGGSGKDQEEGATTQGREPQWRVGKVEGQLERSKGLAG